MINYPGALDTVETLFGNLTDVATTTLNNAINSSDLVVTVSDPSKFPTTRQIILIENELVVFVNRSGNVFNVEERGAYGTTAAAHASGAKFRLVYTAAHHNLIAEAIMNQQSESQFYRSPIISDTVTDPSTLTPVEGQQWIVAPSAIGLWAGEDNKIARWSGIGWEFISLVDGMSVYNIARDGLFSWNGAEWTTSQSEEQRNNTVATMRTGLISGGELAIDMDNTKFTVGAGSAYFIDAYSDPENPTYKFMRWEGITGISVPGLASQNWTFISIDSDGNIVQSPNNPTVESFRDTVFLGILYHRDRLAISNTVFTPNSGVYNYIEQDYIDIDRLFNKIGNVYGPAGSLSLVKASGNTFGPSVNYAINRKNPNVSNDPQVPLVNIFYRKRDSLGFNEYPSTVNIDPNNYDLDDVLTPVPAGKLTIQRIYWNPSLQKTVITYGQKFYDNVQDALMDLHDPGVTDYELTYDSVFRSALLVFQGATDLTNEAEALFLDATTIGTSASGSGEVNSGQNVGAGAEVYKTKMSIFLVFRTLTSDNAAITITQNTDTINFDFVPGAVDHQDLSNVGINTHADIDTFIQNINTYIDPRVILRETPNTLKVRTSPNPGEFSSIAAAVASITTATASSPWVVDVAPGTYVEPTIIMKPYVLVLGVSTQMTIIQASNPNNDLITASYASGIYNCTLTGSTGPGAALVRHNSSAIPGNSFIMNTVNFINAETYIDMNVTSTDKVSAILLDASYGGNVNAFKTAFSIKTNGSGGAAVLLMNAVISNALLPTYPDDIIFLSGLGAKLIGGNCFSQCYTVSGTNGIRMRDGAELRVIGFNFQNFNKGVFIENVGAPCVISADSTSFNNCNEDLRVEQPTATGFLSRPSSRSKIYLDDATAVYVPNVDLQIITVAKRGGDFTSIKSAVDSITDASSIKPYEVHVGPGIFTEDTITMKPYVSLTGSGEAETVLVADGPSKDLIIGVATSSVKDCSFRGVTGASSYVIRNTGVGILTAFTVQNCSFVDNENFVLNDATSDLASMRIDSCRIVGPFKKGFETISSGGNLGSLFLLDIAFQIEGLITEDVCVANGQGSELIFGNVIMVGNGNNGNAIRVYDNASVKILSVEIENFDKGLVVENVGGPSLLRVISMGIVNCNSDIVIDHPGTTGSVTGSFQQSKVSVDPLCQTVFSYTDAVNGSFVTTGKFYLGATASSVVEVSDLFIKAPAMGLLQGGVLTAGSGLTVNVSSGYGYTNNVDLQKIVWSNTSIVLSANVAVYIYFNSNGTLSVSASFPDTRLTILLGRVITNGTVIEIIDASPYFAEHSSNRLDNFARTGLGTVYESGSIVSENGVRNVDISSGRYFLSGNVFQPSGAIAATFGTYYRDGIGGWTIGSNTVVNNQFWDDSSGTLAALTASYYAKHSLYVVGQGINEKYLLVFAQAEYSNLTVVEQADIPTPPGYFTEGITLIASIIVQQGVSNIVEIRDERPVLGFKASGVSASSDHGNLLGLADDDHLQYLLVSGTRAMSGNIDMGGNSVINVNLVDGVDVSAHAARHQPNGADPIPTAAAVGVLPNNVNGIGTSNNLARADHIHALPSGTPVTQTPDQTNTTGTANSVARADHVHNIPAAAPVAQTPDSGNIKGVAATFALSDHQHQIPGDAPVTPLSATTTNDEGTGVSFARNDHVHSILTGVPATQTPDQVNATGSSANLARADHIHNIPADAPTTTLSPATANAEGIGSSFARNDHTHAISTALAADISTIVPDDSAGAGSSATFARGDHKHAIIADAPTTPISAITLNSEGVGTSFARNDHQHSLLSGTPSSQAPDTANATGTSANVARADHIHNIPTAAPSVSLSATTSNAVGTGISFARNDHGHAILTGTPSTQAPDQANATGISVNLARADHIHQIPTAAAVGLNANSTNTQGVAVNFSRADHTHAISSGTPTSQIPDQVNAVGASASFAKADHTHNIPTAAPVTNLSATTGNGQGVGTSFARNDHTHAIVTGAASTQSPGQSNATGSSANLARADHLHQIPTAAPTVPLSASTTDIEGVGSSFARNDHGHSILSGTPIAQTPDQTNATGTSSTVARSDHTHNIPTAIASSISTSSVNARGNSSSFARADHTHQVSIDTYQYAGPLLLTTNSAAYVVLTGATFTPPAGTYYVHARSALTATSNNRTINFAIFVNGLLNSESQCFVRAGFGFGSNTDISNISLDTIVTVNGSQTIDIRWNTSGGTAQSQFRSLILIRKSN